METNRITETIIGAALAVHRALGPGLLESAYKACLIYELVKRGLKIEVEKPLPIIYDGLKINCSYKMDIVVEQRVIIEVKAVEKLDPIFTAQLLTYMKLADYRVGLLINFNVKYLMAGLRRLVNDYRE